jgi:curli biogenesis system outer membrane secretion channel CsgG
MKRAIIFLMTIFLLALVVWAFAEEEKTDDDDSVRKEGRPRISVKTFENPAMYYNSTIGNGVTDMLITKLVQSGRFNVIARNESFEEVKGEIDLGETGYIEDETKVEKGKVKGVDYILMGKVTNFGHKESSGGIGGALTGGFGDVGLSSKKAVVWIDFRLVDATTGETIIAESAEGLEKKSGAYIAASDYDNWLGSVRFDSDEFRDSMVGKATVKAIDAIAEKLIAHFPLTGAIIAVTSGNIIIDLGEGSGIKVGQKLKVLRENVVKNSAGEEVFRESSEIGVVEIAEIQLKTSKAKIISGCSGVREGDIVQGEEKKEDKDKKGKDDDEDEDKDLD